MLKEEIERYKQLLKDDELINYLIDKNDETRGLYEKFLYFQSCIGENCNYADACVKLLKGEIDEFYSGRSTNSTA